MAETDQTKILLQLLDQVGELQKQLGAVTANVVDAREDIKNHTEDTAHYRDLVGQAFANIVTRLGVVEKDISVLKNTMEKTVKPLVTNSSNMKQRIIGFMAAVSLGAAVVGGIVFIGTQVLPVAIKFVQELQHAKPDIQP